MATQAQQYARLDEIRAFFKKHPDLKKQDPSRYARLLHEAEHLKQVLPPRKGGQPPAAAPKGPAMVKNPPTKPFMRPEDLMNWADFKQQEDTALADLDQQAAERASSSKFQRAQTARTATVDRRHTTDEAIGRGLFRSSIRDAALADITAHEVTSNQQLDDQLRIAEEAAARQREIWLEKQHAIQTALQQQMVQNARDASKDAPAYVPGPVAKPPPGPTPNPPKPQAPRPPTPAPNPPATRPPTPPPSGTSPNARALPLRRKRRPVKPQPYSQPSQPAQQKVYA